MFTQITPLTPTKHPMSGGWRTLSLRTRRALTVVLAIGLAFGGMVAVAAPAQAAVETTSYINASGNPASVSANVIVSSGTATMGSSWYVCKSGTLNMGEFNVNSGSTANLILADGCVLNTYGILSYGNGMYIPAGSTLNVFGQSGNTGKLSAIGAIYGAGIYSAGTLNLYGGYTYASAGNCAAGIGGAWDYPNGYVNIAGSAWVYALGGTASGGCGSGAGIGGGGSSSNGGNRGAGTITVNTQGMVRAMRGNLSGSLKQGANVGSGGSPTTNGTDRITVSNVLTPTITGTGSLYVQDAPGNFPNAYAFNYVVPGSRVFYRASPGAGYRTNAMIFHGKNMSGPTLPTASTADFYYDVTTADGGYNLSSSVTFVQNPSLTISASPSSQQTRPGNVTLTATLTLGGAGQSGKTIDIYSGSTKIGSTGATNSNGAGSFTYNSPAAGSYSFQARWAGDAGVVAVNSSTLNYKVVLAPTTLALTASPAGTQTRPGNVTLTATLQSGTSFPNAQPVTFWANGSQVGSANTNALGVATYVLQSPGVGTYSFQARFAETTSYEAVNSSTITGYQVVRASQGSTLTINGLGTTAKIYGDGPYNIDATGGSGTGGITLTSSNPTVASLTEVLLNTSETPVPPLLFGALLNVSPFDELLTSGVGSIDSDTGVLTLNEAGTFTLTATRAQDDTYLASTFTTPQFTVTEATPVATLTRTGGDALTTPIDLTLQVDARGSGSTPQGLVQFYFKGTKLGDPLPLVDNNDGTAEVSLNGIPIEKMGSQNVSAVFLGDPGKYKTVTQSDDWYLGNMGYCKVEMPEA